MTVTDIELRLKYISQLFNELDPSPLIERDLSDAVVDFIVNWATDAGRGETFRLLVHTPQDATENSQQVGEAITNFFSYRAVEERNGIKRRLREGRIDLLSGLIFLLVCTLAARGASASLSGTFGAALAEGLSILGWVANWRPIEIFLYDWRPARERAAIFENLGEMEVLLIHPESLPALEC